MAYVRFDLSDKWQLSVGKMCADWGGIEFDLNPIDIYEYSDIIEMADNFLTGAGVYYQANDNHGFAFQLLDSRTGTFEELYDTVPDVKASKVPLALVFNWRGNFFDGKFMTREIKKIVANEGTFDQLEIRLGKIIAVEDAVVEKVPVKEGDMVNTDVQLVYLST